MSKVEKFRPEDRPELRRGTIFYIDTRNHQIRLCHAKWTQEMLDDALGDIP